MVLTISHQKGGVGKSTIAWNVALHFSKILPVFLVDLDVQQTLTHTNELRQGEGLAPLRLLRLQGEQGLMHHLAKDDERSLTIIDSGGFDSALNRLAILSSDMVITPVSDRPFDLMGLKKYEAIMAELSGIQGETLKTHVLFNNINPSLKRFEELVEFICQSRHFALMLSVIRQRRDIAHSVGSGMGVHESHPGSKSAHEFLALADEIAGVLGIGQK